MQTDDAASRISNILRDARELCQAAREEAAAVDRETDFPIETFRQIAVKNLLRAPLEARFGGADLSGAKAGATLPLLKLLKTIGAGNLAVGRVFEGHVNALLLIELYGSETQKKRFAADVCEQRKIFGVWNTEAADGVQFKRGENGKIKLSGAKTFASGAGFVERPFVNGKLPDNKWQMAIVPMETVATASDDAWWQPLGMRATRSVKVDFTNAEIEPNDLIGEPDDYYRQPWFGAGAIRFAAVQLGGAESLFDLTIEYLRRLARTADLFQRQRTGEMRVRIEAGNLWLAGAANAADVYLNSARDARDSERFLAYANMMRTAIETICIDTMTLCQRSIGARGLLRPEHFERVIRDLTIYLRQPAPDAALADVGRFALETESQTFNLRDEQEFSATHSDAQFD